MSDAMQRLGYADLLSDVPRPAPRGDRSAHEDATAPVTPPPRSRSGRVDVTVYVPRSVAETLRTYQASLPPGPTRLSLGEIVLGVLAATIDTLRAHYGGTMPASSPFGAPLGERRASRRMGLTDAGPLRLKLPADALAAIDEVAAELGLSRSALVSEAIETAIEAGVLAP